MTKRTLDAVRAILLEKATLKVNPASFLPPEILSAAMAGLRSCDRDHWAETFLAASLPYEARAKDAGDAGRTDDAIAFGRIAYNLCQLGRYPAPNSPSKRKAYDQARAHHARWMPLWDGSFVRIAIPSKAGAPIPALVRKPAANGIPLPVIVTWGGIDAYKEERAALTDPYLKAGFAIVAIDMPGTGECPLVGSTNTENLWDGVFDWIGAQADFDSRRIALHGLSTGGYWATKLAHTHKDRVRAVINQGGCAHYAFQPEWIDGMSDGEYPFELGETLASAFGLETQEEWRNFAPSLSLLDQGILDRPCAPLLLVNGTDDSIFPIDDMYLLLRHGSPKTARFYDGFGHMGPGNQTIPMMIAWLQEKLGS